MSEDQSSGTGSRKRPGRREVVSDGLTAFLAAAMVPPFLRPFVSARRADPTPAPSPSPTPEPEGGGSLRTRGISLRKQPTAAEVDARFRPYLGEKLTYTVNFMGLIKAATVNVTFKQGIGDDFITEMEAVAHGVVGWASTTKRQKMVTRLKIMDVGGGKTRLAPTHFSRESEKPDRKYRSLQHFDYKNGYWYYTRYINEKREKRRRRKIPPGVFYEDMVGFTYNLRAGFYGDVNPGDVIKIHGIPFNEVSEYTIRVANAKDLEQEAKWVASVPGARKMGLVEISQKIFGFKPGLGKVLTDDKLVPLAGKIKDVVSYGDVSAELTGKKP